MEVGIYNIEVGDAILNRDGSVAPTPAPFANVKTADGLYLRSSDGLLLNVKEE